MKKFMQILITVIFFFLINILQSQQIKKIDGKKYLIHKVLAKETLYGVSKKYKISIKKLFDNNPNLKRGLKIGETILIPYSSDVKATIKSSNIEINGDTIYHQILKKETLYGISKKYNVSIDNLKKDNPEIKNDKIKIGQKLIIIMKYDGKIPKNITEKSKQDSLILHEIKPKETLFSLAKKYNTSIEQIKKVNNGLKKELLIGTSIRIPIRNKKFLTKNIKKNQKTIEKIKNDDTIDIALLLPFYLEKNNSNQIYENTIFALAFYQGFLLAAEEFKQKGYNIKLKIYDVNNKNKDKIKKIINNESWDDIDLIIGPFFRSKLEHFVDKEKFKNIGFVSPVGLYSKILLTHENVIKIESSSTSKIISISKFIGKNFQPKNVIIITNKKTYFTNIAEKYIQFESKSKELIKTEELVVLDKNYLESIIPDSTHTAILLISEDKLYVTKAISILNSLISNKELLRKITLFGLEKILNFDNLSIEQLMELNTHLISNYFIEYKNKATLDFIYNYQHRWDVQPQKLSYIGYDIANYFIQGVHLYGNRFEHMISNDNEGISIKFDFLKIGTTSGIENTANFILKYKNFELIRIE